MDNGTASGSENGEEENDTWEGPSACQRVWNGCVAFMAAILVIVGELMSEQNLFGAVTIGGILIILNVLITASSLEKARDLEDKDEEDEIESGDDALRDGTSIRRGERDMLSVDLGELPAEEESDTLYQDVDCDVSERMDFLPRVLHHRSSSDRWRYNADSELEEIQNTRPLGPKKRSRRTGRVQEEDYVEEQVPRRNKYVEAWDRKRRSDKPRRERYDGIERMDRYRERDKRERRSRDKKHKKKKRVTWRSGSAEHVIIGEV